MSQFLRDQASDSDEVVTPLMLDGTYLSRNFATLGPLPDSRRLPPSNCALQVFYTVLCGFPLGLRFQGLPYTLGFRRRAS